jgi:tetratricopeptide (TPR) repeat protein
MSNLYITKVVLSLFFMAGIGAISTDSWGFEYDCGELKNYADVGPWDYSDPSSSVPTGADPMGRIKRVENVHFYPDVKNLNTKVLSIEQLTAEIHYTLRVFPNHPLALYAFSRLERLAGGKLPNSSATMFTPRVTAECFFDRALRFRPDDKDVRIVYGIHLHLRNKFKEALEQYQIAESEGADSSFFYYNLGLLYADMKNWEKAVEYGQKAYNFGLDLPGLRQKLEKAGYKIQMPVRTR